MRKDEYVARPLHQRLIAGVLAMLMGIFPIMTPVYAASYSVPTALADTPINVKNQAKPNIVLTVDDSTSMLYDFLPDYVVDKTRFCRDGTGAMNSTCGFSGFILDAGVGGRYLSPEYIWTQPSLPYPTYDSRFDKSGPGASCDTLAFPPTCTGGIDPGPLPGIPLIPVSSGSLTGELAPTGKSPTPPLYNAYPYWQFWPAPAHNAALNHTYYNPRLQYDPPAYPDGKLYPQMDAGNTANWTKVPANPYLNPADPLDCATAPCVDLTANVMVGQWCNSDWTLGNDDGGKPFATNPAYCRTNGVIAAAASGAPAAIGDYMYPWLPSGVSPSVDSKSYPNAISYIDSMVDTSTVQTTPPLTNATVRANWDSVKDPKYYFQNENVLWCDLTSPEWPQTITNPTKQTCDMTVVANAKRPVRLAGGLSASGTMSDASPTLLASISNTCVGYNAAGSCAGASATGNCTGYVAGTCNTGNGTCAGYVAGACNTGSGTCAGFTAGACNTGNGTCAGFTAGACNTANGTCAGNVAGTCNTTPGNCNGVAGVCNTGNGTCAGFVAGACNTTSGNCNGGAGTCNTGSGNCAGFVAGACSGFSAGSCGAATSCSAGHETCNAGTAASCGGIAPQTCNNTKLSCDAQSQTCQGAQGAQTCANIVAIPPDPSTCHLTWIDPSGNPSPPSPFPCPNPDPEGQQCTLQNLCPPPTFAGTCSKSGKVCAADADCPFIYGTCSIQTTKQCSVNSDCSGLNYCHNTTQVCATPGPNAADCPNNPGAGKCSVTNAACTNDVDCPGTGTCNYQNNGGINNGICFSTADCKPFPNRCAITTTTICPTPGANAAACPVVSGSGICTYGNGFTGGACTTTADCSNRCQNAGATVNAVCASNAACTDNGACSAGKPATTVCTIATDCNVNGSCTTGANTGAACTANGVNAACGAINKCSAGKPATTVCAINTDCNTAGTCTTGINTGVACTGSGVNVTCGPIDKCTAGKPATTVCAIATDCNVNGSCTSGANTGAVCTVNGVNAACGAVNKCTAGTVGAACASNAQCNGAGVCTTGVNVGAACTGPGANAACGAIDRCSAGKPATTVCAINADCNVSGTCSTGANTGAVCTTNGVNAACGKINKCSAGKPATTACAIATDCNVNGSCTSGLNTGASCTANGVNVACGAVNKCTAGLPATTSCGSNAACNVNGSCTSGANTGASCTVNGVNAACGAVNKCTAGLPATTSCGSNAACTINGACTSGANTGASCTVNGVNAACGAVNLCTTGKVGAACASNGACDTGGSCTSGNVGASCTVVGATAQCAQPNGFCDNYPPNTQACTLANQATNCAGSTGHCSFDSAVCTTDTDCASYGRCSVDNKVCTSDAQCPDIPGPKGPANATCDDKTTTLGLTLIQDAASNGIVCRRNNHTYPDVAAGQVTYPMGKFTTPVNGEQVAGQGCSPTARYTTVPRHYWKTEVEFCDNQINPPGDRWLGYGKPGALLCQESYDSVAHPYPRFYQHGGTPTVDPTTGLPTNGGNPGTYNDPALPNGDPSAVPAFARVDLLATATFTAAPEYGSGLAAVTRSYGGATPDLSEMVNYANWFAYYRTRILSVKTVTSLAFLGKSFGTFNVDDSYRVGFHTLFNKPSTTFVDVADFDAVQKPLWATQLFGINIPLGQETPTLDAMARIGDYFLNGGSAELTGSTDPIVLSCQKNWHMLFTDGFTNQGAPKSSAGDQDKVVPTYPDFAINPIPGLNPGTNWPAPLSEDLANPVLDALADFAMKYWVTDLRTAGGTAVNNVPGTQTDPATWQHLNFAALSLGTAGTLPPNAMDSPPYPAWPKPSPVNKPGNAGVDDLWHAATNARGAFVNAQSADEVKLGMGSILADIANQKGARASAGFQNSNIAGTNNFIYRALFQPGWYGTLTKITIDPVTGAEGAPVWEAADQLQAQLTVIPGVKDTPWFTERNIATMDATGKAVPFLWPSLSSAPVDQQDSLAPGKPARSKRVLEWIRGNTQFEGKKVGQFRSRTHAPLGEQFLGDIVDSKPVYVGPPNKGYLESFNTGYAAFTVKYQDRPPMVYVGANDGMVHGFTDGDGNEAFAYVPSQLYRGDATGLGALTYQDGALPPFTHHYLVDSTPKAWDVDFGGADWHTVLVGGLGKGGNSYYAIDITDPVDHATLKTTEVKAVKSVLWEFTDANLGFTFGQATIVKTHATSGGFTSGQWVAIVPSGYDNADGIGRIFFIDIKTGKKLKEMSTGFGSAGAPSGLAQISGYTKDRKNQLVEQVYGGDLYGNFWRFDVHDTDPAKWVVEKLATLDDGTNPQPITVAPQIEIDVQNGVDRWVFIGTGRLLDDTDLAVSQQQTMYAIRDGDLNNPLPAVNQPTGIVPRSDMKQLTDRVAGLPIKPDIGWFDDLPKDQRIVTPIQADISVVAYTGTSPQTDPCLLGQPATIYARGFAQGESLLTDAGGSPVAGIDEPEGGVGLQLVQLEPEPGSTLYNIQIAVTLGTGKTIFIKPTLPTYLISHRMSWRLLNQ